MLKLFKFIAILMAYFGTLWFYFKELFNKDDVSNLLLIVSTLFMIVVSVLFFRYTIKTIINYLNL